MDIQIMSLELLPPIFSNTNRSLRLRSKTRQLSVDILNVQLQATGVKTLLYLYYLY